MIGSSILSIIPDKTACRCRPGSIPTARAEITDLADLEIMWHLVSTCFSSLSTTAALVKCWPKCSQWIVIMVRSYERSLLWWNISVYWQKNIYQQAFIKHSNSFDVDSNVKRKTSTTWWWWCEMFWCSEMGRNDKIDQIILEITLQRKCW